MKKYFLLFSAVLLLSSLSPVKAQHFISFSADFSQIQEALNNEMVFSGPALTINYNYYNVNDNAFIIKSGIGVGILFNRGIIGVSANLTPIDIFYGFETEIFESVKTYIGPKLHVGYNVQIYPDLQSGLDYWATNINLSPAAMLDIPYDDDIIRVEAAVSVFGLLSRTPQGRNPYFFSLNFFDIMEDLHSDMEAGSLNKFLHTTLSADFPVDGSGSWVLGYGLDYFTYFDEPGINLLNHSVKLRYNLGGE